MMSMIAEHVDEVRVRRYGDVPECDVVVAVRGLEMSLRCRDYNQAVKWARIECRSYKIAGGFTVMPKVGKTAHKLDAIVRAEAVSTSMRSIRCLSKRGRVLATASTPTSNMRDSLTTWW